MRVVGYCVSTIKNTILRKLPILLVSSGVIMLAFTQCAHVMSPTGGPKDSLAPVIVRSLPAQFSRNVAEKKLELSFNEYVTLKDLQKNLYVSPPIDEELDIREKGKKIEVLISKKLQNNTTYSINFANSIVDVNENNPVKNFSYIFSTGSQLDTMRLNGKVFDAKTMRPMADAFIFMYENDSLEAPMRHKPNVISKTDKNGIFIANNLKNKSYKIIAIKDANRNYLFDPGFDDIAFDKKRFGPVNISARPDTMPDSTWRSQLPPQVKLKIFSEEKRQQYIKGKDRSEKYKMSVFFNSPNPIIKKLAIDGLTENDFLIQKTANNDTITYWLKDATRKVADTLVANYTYMKSDSTGKLVETVEKISWELPLAKSDRVKSKKKEAEESKKVSAATTQFEMPDGTVNDEGGLFMNLNLPLTRLDTSKFSLVRIDENDAKVPIPFKFKPVTNSLTSYEIVAKWIEDSRYEIVADSNVVTNIAHAVNDSIKFSFQTSSSSKFGTFLLDFKNVKTNLIVQILDSKYKVTREKIVLKNGVVKFPYIKASSYYIRIVEDANKNGVWDTGNYLNQVEPERVGYLHKEKEEQFQLRTGWENEITVDIDEVFANY